MKIGNTVRAGMLFGVFTAVSPGPFSVFSCLIKIVEKELIRGILT